MNDETFKQFVGNCIWICLIMAPLSLLRWKVAGPQCLFLAGAFLSLSGFLYALNNSLATFLLSALGVLTFLFLAGDAVTRKKRK